MRRSCVSRTAAAAAVGSVLRVTLSIIPVTPHLIPAAALGRGVAARQCTLRAIPNSAYESRADHRQLFRGGGSIAIMVMYSTRTASHSTTHTRSSTFRVQCNGHRTEDTVRPPRSALKDQARC
ncbi:hypothetical protein PR003_g13282 [Phytophthora rubi]|uniref:Uncharacterized protein n=1 Tax=Phytophthora rubi TaxID=129364 RepID=A0A6A3MBU3_9STRA|nr:hypothetical protein PR002_g12760 [Phytophthora rubi]KAE9025703.1 hypothetical protein PR001_g12368 [Phytophthora rubi]KAE9334896.1 hypothetical protein PR003_g13282 [Phytophthora rubi]